MKREPVSLVKTVVLALHEEQIAEHGGADGPTTEGQLDSALARPRQAYASGAPGLFEMAAALAFGLVRNDPFVDGNKRTSLVASEVFLDLNGVALHATDEEAVTVWTALADGSLSETELVKMAEGSMPAEDRRRLDRAARIFPAIHASASVRYAPKTANAASP